MASDWTHLIRFVHNGAATFAHLVNPKYEGSLEEQFQAEIVTGDPVFNNIKRTGEVVTVVKADLLAPFATMPLAINTGLNYRDHVTESLFNKEPNGWPTIPVIFYRPTSSIGPPYPKLHRVYKIQQECLDYEGELIFQTGSETVKDLSEEEAHKHIMGFTVGCDFSPRPGKVLGRMNFIYSKAFDEFAPCGPVLVNSSVVGTAPELVLTTKWNGKVVQSDNTRNMIFKCARLLSTASTGTTVKPGTICFTGTCGGGAWFKDDGAPGTGIQDGDEIEVNIERIGTIRAFPSFDK